MFGKANEESDDDGAGNSKVSPRDELEAIEHDGAQGPIDGHRDGVAVGRQDD